MRRRPEAVAALVNGLFVWLLPAGISALFTIGGSLGIGASDTNTTVYADGWNPLDPIMATALRFGIVTLPFAVVAAWRTWVHAKRRRVLGTSGWQGVAEAGACGPAAILIVLIPLMLSRPTHVAQVAPFVLAYAVLAALCGLLIGLLLRVSALIVLKLTEPKTNIELTA